MAISRCVTLLFLSPRADPIVGADKILSYEDSIVSICNAPDHLSVDLRPSITTFSWLDLPAVGEFALTNNESIAGSFDRGLDRFDDSSNDGFGGGMDPALMIPPQYAAWDGQGQGNIIF